MKPITEEERQELIKYVKSVLSSHVQRGGDGNEEDVFKIALASLTAKPIGVAIGEKSFALTGKMVGGDSVYTAPPVPVIKLPEFISNSQYGVGEYTSGRVCGYNECLTEIKRLNGLGE